MIYHFIEKGPILVFGSNEAGIHGAGAAKFALIKRGAVMHQGIGMTGNSYAFPTKDRNIETLPIEKVKHYAQEFKNFARANPSLKFQLTRVGCGLAGFTDREIYPLFEKDLPPNVYIPGYWSKQFKKTLRILIDESLNFKSMTEIKRVIDKVRENYKGFELRWVALDEKTAEFLEQSVKEPIILVKPCFKDGLDPESLVETLAWMCTHAYLGSECVLKEHLNYSKKVFNRELIEQIFI